MEVRQIIRLLTFGYCCLLPNLLSFWIMPVLLEILDNNLNVKDKEAQARAGGFFFSSLFWGVIIGCLIWPYVINYMSKRMSILIGLVFMALLNGIAGQTTSLLLIYFCRAGCGAVNNLNSVGKDFVFDFAKDNYRQYCFNLKTFFTFVAYFIGPFFGYYLYIYSGHSYSLSMLYISGFFIVGVVAFIIVFFFDYSEEEAEANNKPAVEDEEEKERIVEPKEKTQTEQKAKGLPEVIKKCWVDLDLRNIIFVYFLTNGVYKSISIISIFLLELSWAAGGFGVSAMTISYINLFAFIPTALLVLVSPSFVPKPVPYGTFIRVLIYMLMVVIIFLPFLRDIFTEETCRRFIWIVYLAQGMVYLSVPKNYSPFINFYLNSYIDRASRTAMNSYTFIMSNLSAAVILGVVSPLFGFTMFNPALAEWRAYSKYITFIFLDILLIIAVILSRRYK